MKTIVIIPSRMASKRFPGKPMAKINDIPMIERVWKQAMNSNIGNVYVACSETDLGGMAIMTDPNLPSGSDRVHAALSQIKDLDDLDSIINLQGDLPIINPTDIIKVNQPILNGYEVGTLATNLSYDEEKNINITKVKIQWNKETKIGKAIKFYKHSEGIIDNIYHHVGIYSFKPSILDRFVKLPVSKNEINHQLEQWRLLDANIKIGIIFVDNGPLSVDTKEDLIHIEKIIKDTNNGH